MNEHAVPAPPAAPTPADVGAMFPPKVGPTAEPSPTAAPADKAAPLNVPGLFAGLMRGGDPADVVAAVLPLALAKLGALTHDELVAQALKLIGRDARVDRAMRRLGFVLLAASATQRSGLPVLSLRAAVSFDEPNDPAAKWVVLQGD